jgi:hypothetical protein
VRGAGAVLGIEDVDAVPAARALGGGANGCSPSISMCSRAMQTAGGIRTLLQEHTACKAIVHVPEVNTRYAAFKVSARVSYNSPAMAMANPARNSQLPVDIKRLIGFDLHLADTITRRDSLIDGRFELVAPRTPPAVAVAVVVAAQEVALRL